MEAGGQEVSEAWEVIPLASPPHSKEVLPHHYGTSQTGPSQRAAESLHGEADGSGRTDTPQPQPGYLGCVGVDGGQVSTRKSPPPLCGATADSMVGGVTPPAGRGGDNPGPGVG